MLPACEIWPLCGQVCSQGSVPLSSVTVPSPSRGPEEACPDSAYSGTGSQVPENLQACLSQVMLAQGHILLMGTWVHPRSVEGRDSGARAQLWLCPVLLGLRRQVGTACGVQRQGLAAQTHCKQWCSPPRSGTGVQGSLQAVSAYFPKGCLEQS